MAGNQPWTKLCPNCLEPNRRNAEHVEKCCKSSGWSDTDRLKAMDNERERIKQLCTVSYEIDSLKTEFPDSYLDISSVLIRSQIPVYRVVKEKTHFNRFRTVHRYTNEEIWNLRKQQAQPTAQTSSGQTTSVEVTRQMVTEPLDDHEDSSDTEQILNQAEAIRKMISQQPGGKAKGGKIKSTRPAALQAPQQPQTTTSTTAIDVTEARAQVEETEETTVVEVEDDREENEPFQPRVRKRSNIIRSDDEEENEVISDNLTSNSKPEPKSNRSNSRTEINEKLDKYYLYVRPEDSKEIIKTNEYVKKVETLMKAATRQDAQTKAETETSRKDTILNTLRNAIRIMRFMAPNHVIGDFRWACLADSGKLTEFFNVLKHEINMLPNTISNYHKAMDLLFKGAENDPDFRLSQPKSHAHVLSTSKMCEAIKRGTHKDKSKRQTDKRLEKAYSDIKKTEISFVNIFKNLEKVRKVAVPIIMKAKNKRVTLSDGDLKIVNGFFNVYSTVSLGNRPAVFQNMRVDVFEMADKCRQVREDGSAYYFLATSDHKTGSNDLAYIYVEEEDWELFRIYRRNIRKKPVSEDKHLLFINSNGRRIYNPSTDLSDILKRYGVEEMNCTDARHIITTIACQYCTEEEQDIIHRMLTHTPATAKKNYAETSTMAVPHRRGIPLLESLQKTLAGKHNMKVTSFLRKCPSQLPQPQVNNSPVEPPVVEERAPSPSSSTSTEDDNESGQMRDLLKREFGSLSATDELPGRKDYREAIKKYKEMGLPAGPKAADNFVALCSYERAKARAKLCAEHYRRTKITDINEAVEKFLATHGWSRDKKAARQCKSSLDKLVKSQQSNKRVQTSDDISLLKQINDQEWPDIVARRCSKKMGIFASRDIEAGSLLCDYHGTLVNEEEGERRYKEYGDTDNNVYMYMIQCSGTVYWIDAVVPCSCHPKKKLKGRLLNGDRHDPNVIARIRFLNERPHVLLYAKRNIKKLEELMFDYGCYKDRMSSQQNWM